MEEVFIMPGFEKNLQTPMVVIVALLANKVCICEGYLGHYDGGQR